MNNVTVPFLFFLEEFLTTATLYLKKAQPMKFSFDKDLKAYIFPIYWTDGKGSVYESIFKIKDVGKKMKPVQCEVQIGIGNKELVNDVHFFLCSMGNHFSKAWNNKSGIGVSFEEGFIKPEHFKTLFKTV